MDDITVQKTKQPLMLPESIMQLSSAETLIFSFQRLLISLMNLYRAAMQHQMKYLKKLFTLLVIVLFACGFAACSSDDEEPEEPALEVTPANLHGTWKLVEWNNGEQVPEGTYCYIVFNRKEQIFEMYQKFDSMYGRHITGSFAIKNDPYQGYIISGSYDYGMGDWNQSYLVTRLLASGSMIWTGKDDATDVCRYERCSEVPAEVIKESKDFSE